MYQVDELCYDYKGRALKLYPDIATDTTVTFRSTLRCYCEHVEKVS